MIESRARLRILLPVILAVLLLGCQADPNNAAGRTPTPVPTASPTQSVPAETPDPNSPMPTAAPKQSGPAAPAAPTAPSSYVMNGTGNSLVEQAHAQLLSQGNKVFLIIVSPQSTGLEGEIYQDLIGRDFRATAGTDEGFDTHAEFCYPDCVFVRIEAINQISVASWRAVLTHEYRHITQARNNSTMAQDFRDANGEFTTYAAFSEACADYGVNVAPVYLAQTRIDSIKSILGAGQQDLAQACDGDKPAYLKLVDEYNNAAGGSDAFQHLFPPYQ